jgi:CcmD family protein
VSNTGWLAAAFVIVWVVIGAYVMILSRAQRDISRRLDEIERIRDRPPSS